MTTILLKPAQLKISERNVRRKGPGNVDDVMASIVAHGLLHPLIVGKLAKRDGSVSHEIFAGGRRWTAIKKAIAAKTLPRGYEIECKVIEQSDLAIEISTAENEARATMHPADQFEAFAKMIDAGASVTDVAARFGTTAHTVTRRMKLGRLAPQIMKDFRADKIDLETAAAYALTDDQDAQREAYKALGGSRMVAWRVRDHFTQGHVPLSDKRVRLIGIAAYEAAGGSVMRDLLDDNRGTVANEGLLNELVAARMEAARLTLDGEGWKWTAIHSPGDHYDHRAFDERVYPAPAELSVTKQKQLDKLSAKLERLETASENDPDNDELRDECEELSDKINAMQGAATVYSAEDKARAGAMVMLDYDGGLRIERGLVRKEDARKEKEGDKGDGAAIDKAKGVSPALRCDLSRIRTAMMQAAMTGDGQEQVALATIAHAFAIGALYHRAVCEHSALDISVSTPNVRSPDNYDEAPAPFDALDANLLAWKARLPSDPRDLLAWCFEQPTDTLLSLLACAAARTVNAQVLPNERVTQRHAACDQLAEQLKLDPHAYAQADRLGYFRRVPKAHILDVLASSVSQENADNCRKMKKGDLVDAARAALTGKWLPDDLMRTARDKSDEASFDEDAGEGDFEDEVYDEGEPELSEAA